jgi:hypothetical protein
LYKLVAPVVAQQSLEHERLVEIDGIFVSPKDAMFTSTYTPLGLEYCTQAVVLPVAKARLV